ncbi:MAG: desulfoferrodoxin family protein [Sulfuricurvum sp.]|jgi:superoxide reductase
MKKRRDFIKTSLLTSAGLVAAAVLPASATDNLKESIFTYSQGHQGRWEGKAGSHAPVITIDGNKITMETKHGMSEAHYIVKHSLLDKNGKVLGEQIFFPHDKKAISTFVVEGKYNELYALSFCNVHDLWVTEFSI